MLVYLVKTIIFAFNLKHMKRIIFIFIAVGLVLLSCGKSAEDILKDDITEIESYLSANGLVAQSTASGLHYIIDNPGNGQKPGINNVVTVKYKGYFTDDAVFDQSGNAGVSFPLSNVIEGWQEGIPLFGKGGNGILLIPSSLGYADNPPPGFPSNAVLIFDVELLDFN